MSYIKFASLLSSKLMYLKPQNHNRLFSTSIFRLTKNPQDDIDENQPIKFSQTKAAKWKAENTRSGYLDDSPWYQPYVISASLAVFMVYFFILREESDIDLEFDKNLYDRISGLEEKQLELSKQYNLEQGLSTQDIDNRLQQIKKENER